MTTVTTPRAPVPPATGTRLLLGLSGSDTVDASLGSHLERWGTLPRPGDELLDELETSRLVGHGGGWFPVAAKWRSVATASRRRPVVVANGAESEPASRKDALLLTRAPHLVLDGLSLAAATLRAHRAIVYVPRHTAPAVEHALDERRRRRTDAVDIEIAECPHTYLAGQETAVVNQLGGRRDAVPAFQGLTSIRERGVDGRATLVQNAETLAHVALIGRFGGTWFRSVGAEDSPGTMLMTVTRAAGAHIVEAVLGSSLRQSAWISDDDMATTQGVLLGGYGGGWVSPRDFGELPVSEKAARRLGATLGAGVVALLPRDVCPLAEMAHVIRYMEGQGAGQCGPCVYGLADLAAAMEVLAWGRGHGSAHPARILEVCDLVEGRGACRHPDGVARFARSGLAVFAEEVAAHVQHGPCARMGAPRVLPGPGRAHPPAGAGRGTTSRRLVSRA